MPTGTNGNDTLIGSDSAEDIYGLAGNDTIFGRGGNDRLYGDDGNDFLYGDLGNDMLYGGNNDDELNGGGGDDYLIGGTLPFGLPPIGFQIDTLNGGEGNDIIAVTDNSSNRIDGGLGYDELVFSVNRTQVQGLIVNLQNLWTLGEGVIGTGYVRGIEGIKDNLIDGTNALDYIFVGDGYLPSVTLRLYDGDDSGSGGSGDDNLFAGIGNDRLAGGGGNDVLRGEEGNDNLFGDAGNDILAGGIGDDRMDGGTGNDYLIGEAGADQLTGGSGINTLQGGVGDDIYFVSNATDSIIEFSGEGTDEVRTALSIYGLQGHVENLTYTNNATHGAGVGNSLDNVLAGGTGNDSLFGRDGNDTLRGGTGAANTLLGQQGDDIYVVEAAGDSVIEFAGEGNDTVQTALGSFTLSANVETLVYTGVGDFVGIGNAGMNILTGGAGQDFLSALDGDDALIGGSGDDLLIGGNGADQFRYSGAETGLDRILDFVSGSDRIALSTAGFAHTATVDFVSSGTPAATTGNSTFLYDVNSGIVSYDADGTGAAAAIQLAQLNAGLSLSAGDFIFY
jgi:Ca2+-binding RTX toxin-like protein